MDADGFDRLTKNLAFAGTRRGVVRLLSVLPFGVVLAILRGETPETTAKGDGRGRSQRGHRRPVQRGKRHGGGKKPKKGKRRSRFAHRSPLARPVLGNAAPSSTIAVRASIAVPAARSARAVIWRPAGASQSPTTPPVMTATPAPRPTPARVGSASAPIQSFASSPPIRAKSAPAIPAAGPA